MAPSHMACAQRAVWSGLAVSKARMAHAGFCVFGAFVPRQVHTQESLDQ
jgi:hypothetical protein